MPKKLNALVNWAILVTLLILVLGPSGPVGGWMHAKYLGWQERQDIAEVWGRLVDDPITQTKSSRTIVEFIDYQCPACRMVASTVSRAVQSSDLQLVVRHLPLAVVHTNARDAALAVICAESFGLLREAHDALMEDETWLESSRWTDFAIHIGILDTGIADFERCLDSQVAVRRLEDDMTLAESLGIEGTPTFVTVNGIYRGIRGFSDALATLPES